MTLRMADASPQMSTLRKYRPRKRDLKARLNETRSSSLHDLLLEFVEKHLPAASPKLIKVLNFRVDLQLRTKYARRATTPQALDLCDLILLTWHSTGTSLYTG